MLDPTTFMEHLPPQWLGIAGIILFTIYVVGQLVEKYEQVAKALPLGEWWHKRQARKAKPIDAADVAKALEDARQQWELDGNSALTMLEARLTSIAAVAKQQVIDIDELQATLRAFRSWSSYDSRWHHKHQVDNAEFDQHITTPHYDFFEYEQVWRADPGKANALI